MTKKKIEPLMCYFYFMYNAWNETQARKVFAEAPCGWQYLWRKWCACREDYGLYGAITAFYTECLDGSLRETLAAASDAYYNK